MVFLSFTWFYLVWPRETVVELKGNPVKLGKPTVKVITNCGVLCFLWLFWTILGGGGNVLFFTDFSVLWTVVCQIIGTIEMTSTTRTLQSDETRARRQRPESKDREIEREREEERKEEEEKDWEIIKEMREKKTKIQVWNRSPIAFHGRRSNDAKAIDALAFANGPPRFTVFFFYRVFSCLVGFYRVVLAWNQVFLRVPGSLPSFT